ncbi:MAG: DNA/RNA helicase domain-containing protein [Planctomycetota bacterium]
MLLYQNATKEFCNDVTENRILGILTDAASSFSFRPSYSEINSWQNSLSRVRDLLELAKLDNNYIALEYEIPYNQNRIDCLLFGKDKSNESNIVLIELKQWSKITPLEDDGNYVETFTGNNTRRVAHPSQQVKGYHEHLINFVEEFEKPPPLILFSCSYCHNYTKDDNGGLFSCAYKTICSEFPVFCKEDTLKLANQIKELLAKGDGFEIFNRFMQSNIKPSKKLLDNASKIIDNEPVFSLLGEQIVAKNLIWSKVNKATKLSQKHVIIVHGGPGTGKSVIAINILADAAKAKKKVFYGCKSKPFLGGLKYSVKKGSELLFSNLLRFVPKKVKENEFDLLLIDEAHRIEKTSNNRYTKAEDRSDMPQVQQLIRCAKTTVFFIDDRQNVRSQETGNSDLIKKYAKELGAIIEEVELKTQFRCMGSNNYLEWIESVLGFKEERKVLKKTEKFDFKIFDSPQKLYDFIYKKEFEKANSARVVAGYCWPWSDPNPDGSLVKDVQIGSFKMPWEARDGFRLAKGTPKWYEWAYKTKGVEQVGCIYTAQGFEFDYIGVIIGDDLVYDPATDSLKADINANSDSTLKRDAKNIDTYIRNIYRVLFSRGMKGCYVYFTNKATEKFFKSRMEQGVVPKEELMIETQILEEIPEKDKFKEYLPVYSLKAAAGKFGSGEEFTEKGWKKVNIGQRLGKGMFIAKVIGHSMEPRILDNSYCVFRKYTGGSRQNLIVLALHHAIDDPETHNRYTVKTYKSEKEYNSDGTWRHTKIVLEPINTEYKPIDLSEYQDEEIQIIAEFIAVI